MRAKRLIYRNGAALLLAMVAGGVGLIAHSYSSPGHTAFAAGAKKVVIKETANRYHYTPAKIAVAKGTRVTWTNMTDAEHNVTITQGVKINKDIPTGKSVSFTFTKAGTYHYHCEYHPYMKGTVVVK